MLAGDSGLVPIVDAYHRNHLLPVLSHRQVSVRDQEKVR